MRVVDNLFVNSSDADIALMVAAMDGLPMLLIEDLIANVPEFAGKTEGELSQIATDAGYTVEAS